MSPRMHVGAALAIGLAMALHAARAEQPARDSTQDVDHRQWNAPQQPFRIYGNTWYVGPHGLSAILVDTGQGLALFDGGLPASAPVIEANVRALGFQVSDIKWILNSHAHPDHAGGIAALQRDSGAQVLASVAGVRALARGGANRDDPQYGLNPGYPPVRDARPVRDGQTLRFGTLVVTAHATPGHTPGSMSWSWVSCGDEGCLRMVYADSLSAIAAPGFRFRDHPRHVAAFRQAIATVAALPCDILLTPHPGASGFWEKVARRTTPADAAPLVDAGACRAYAATATANLDARLAGERTRAAGASEAVESK